MGEVYRAHDKKLARDVAIKILPESFSQDRERVARFHREAQLLAALKHPHIAAVHGLEESSGSQCLVMELVDGETLAQRLVQGAVPVAEALAIARQLADGLYAAHEKGIIHRDLKPSNIAFTAEGQVKILDFGLAKLEDATSGTQADLSHSPTLSANVTHRGVILGTAAYMSPEQSKGRPVDKRTDVWAFGCVLYEILTGKRTFDGDDVSDTLATILKSEPDWSALPSDLPQPIRSLLRRCLEKDRNKRMADISTAAFVIDEQADFTNPAKTAAPVGQSSRLRIGVPVAAALGAAALTAAIAMLWTRPGPPFVSRLMITPPARAAVRLSGIQRDLAIAPDGRSIVYSGGDGSQLFVRPLDQLDPIPLTGLGNPISPFFSPDSQWVGFFDTNLSLKKVAVTGGPPLSIANITDGSYAMGATWGADATIVFATANSVTGLLKASANGGAVTVLTQPNRNTGEADHVWPEFLPGGRSVLFTITSTSGQIENAQIAVIDLQTATQKVLVRGGSHGRYLKSGHLVYGRSGTIMAVAFDLERLSVVGVPVPVLSPVVTSSGGSANFDISSDGTLAYVTGDIQAAVRSLVWVDRQGKEEPLNVPLRTYLYPRISPNGSRIALDIRDQDNDIWMWDVARKTLTRFTSELAVDRFPVWTPDGRRLIFNSDRDGTINMYWQLADGTAPAERLTQSTDSQFPTAVSPDGTRLIFAQSGNRGTAPRELMMLTLNGERLALPLVQTPTADQNGQISPDGRWLAYDADESGRFEIYVRPFPDVKSERWQVSNAGGIGPLWSRNGQELFYWSPTGAMMAVPIGIGPKWSAGEPVKLFEGAQYMRGNTQAAPTFDVLPDGRFILIKPTVGSASSTPNTMIIVQNWFVELQRLARRN